MENLKLKKLEKLRLDLLTMAVELPKMTYDEAKAYEDILTWIGFRITTLKNIEKFLTKK
jgi:hypothetical protein